MKKIIILPIVFICFLQQVYATHLMGGNMTYRCLTEDIYELELALYRDCRGVHVSNNVQIEVFSLCPTISSVNLTLSLVSHEELVLMCDDSLSPCVYPFQPELGIEKYIFRGVLDLRSFSCDEFQLVFAQCCRNNAIQNIESGQSMAINAYLNKEFGCFDSPQFKYDPVDYACIFEVNEINNGISKNNKNLIMEIYSKTPYTGTDIVNDELVFNVVNVNGGTFNPEDPLFGTSTFDVNKEGGDITFIVSTTQVSVFTIEVEQYLGEELVSTVRRDLQFIITDCPNAPPDIVPAQDYYIICAGDYFELEITATDPLEEFITLNRINPIPGSNLNNASSLEGEAKTSFTWMPTPWDISETPYQFTVFAKTNSCPYPGIKAKTYFIEVEECPIEMIIPCERCLKSFAPIPGETYVVSAWVKEGDADQDILTYENPHIIIEYNLSGPPYSFNDGPHIAKGKIIEGWQRIYFETEIPAEAFEMDIIFASHDGPVYFDDIRFQPLNSNMQSYVYDYENLRLVAVLDENNYATFYEYDQEGNLTRVKKETERGIMTIQEHRQALPLIE